MGNVAVVTDSSACLPTDLVERFRINVLPISLYLPEEQGTAGPGGDSGWSLSEDAELEELSAANRPFVTEYLAAVERNGFDAAVVVTPAIEFAAMYRNASLAAELATRPAVAIDARTAAAGQALVVLAGAETAAAGGDLADVVAAVEDARRRVELVASLASLEPLRRSGPVPEAMLSGPGHGGSALLGARSIFRMRDGTIEPLGETENAEETLAAICKAFEASTPWGAERSTVFHAGAAQLAARLEKMLGGVDFVSGFSVAMQVHTGQGVVGAAWLPRISR